MDRTIEKEVARRIGRRLRAARRFRGISRQELAEKSEISIGLLQRYEAGRGRIWIDELERLAAALRLPVAHFLEACAVCGGE